MNQERGQSLIEILIATAVFVITVSALSLFILNTYVSGRFAQEITIANYLAQEGLEAARSIRDNNWSNFTIGEHGLAISGNNWVFQGNKEDVSNQLRGGERKIIIEDIGLDRKKVTAKVTWFFSEARPQEVQLVTHFTNWAKLTPYLAQLHYRW